MNRRVVQSARYLALVMLPVTIWAVALGSLYRSQNSAISQFWGAMMFTALAFLPATAWVFIVAFAGHASWLSRKNSLLLFSTPAATTLVIWTNPIHHWFVRDSGSVGGWLPGFWFWIYVGYSFLIGTAILLIALQTALRSAQPYRGQALTILSWVGLSLAIVLVTTLLKTNSWINSLPMILPLMNSLGFAWAVFRFRLFDLAPVDSQTLIENMSDSMLVLDRLGRVVDANHAWERLANVSRAAILGLPISQIPAPWNELAAQVHEASAKKEMVFDRAAERLYLHLQITPLHGKAGIQGYLLIFHDLMTQKLMKSLEERIAARTRDLSTLYEIASLMNESTDLPTILEGCLTKIMKTTGCDGGAIFPGPSTDTPSQADMQIGLPEGLLGELLFSPLWKRVAEKGEPLLVHQSRIDRQIGWLLPEDFQFQSLMATPIPLHESDQEARVLAVFANSTHHFNVEDLSLLVTVADQIGIALENDRLRQQARNAAVAGERQRLARDLHDSIAQTLYSQILFAKAAQKQVGLKNEAQASEYLERLSTVSQQALREMRLLIFQLRPAEVQDASLEEMLSHRLEIVEQRAGLSARLEGDWNLPFKLCVRETLYRIAEESLNNALKHANASEVVVTLQHDPAGLKLEVCDNGCGFEPESARIGLGIKNLQERAAQLGGRLEILSSRECGTRVSVQVPAAKMQEMFL